MLSEETVKIVAFVSQVKPAQRIDEFTADAWHEVLGHLEYDDVYEAAKRVARREKWIDPSELIAEVKIIRRSRLDKANPIALLPACDPDDPIEYRRQLQANTKAVADGRAPEPAAELPSRPVQALIANTFRNAPPAPVRTLQEPTRIPVSPRTRALARKLLEQRGQVVDGELVDEGGAA